MDTQTLISGAVTIAVGALAGGVTNAVAVWMLFHPHEPLKLGPFTLHGAIPKNKARLARSVGRTVGERLLTPEDLSRRLADGELRALFDRAISRATREFLDHRHGSLAETAGPDAAINIAAALPGLASRIAERLTGTLQGSGEYPALAKGLERLAEQLDDQPLSAHFGPEAGAALRTRAERWISELASGEELVATLTGVISAELDRLLEDDRPLIARLPAGLAAALEQAVADSLPTVLERVGDALEEPEARAEVLSVMREGIDHALRDLLLHQRLLAKLVITDEALATLLDTFAGEGADRLAADLRQGPLQARLRLQASAAVQTALRVPLGARLQRLGPEGRRALAGNLAVLARHAVASEGFSHMVGRALDRLLQETTRRSWGDLVRAIPAGQAVRLLAEALDRPEGRRWASELIGTILQKLLTRPIGRPADWLGEEIADQLARTTADAAWRWVHGQVPTVVGGLQVEEMVEQKVLGFSTQRMEEIVRKVTQRELDLIVRLGYWLGALVGLAAFALNLWLG